MTIPVNTFILPPTLARKAGLKSIVSPLAKEKTEIQLDEIFIKNHYRKGKVKRDMVIVDAGASMGMASLYFRKYAKVIYALEPCPTAYVCLVENTKNFPNIKPVNIGLGNTKGTVKLISGKEDPVPDSIFGEGQIAVDIQVTGMSELLGELGLDHIDLLKVDVEGAECWIFQSESFKKAADKIDLIVGESHYFSFFTPQLMSTILAESGFKTKFLPDTNYYSEIDYQDYFTKEAKRYHVPYQTLFVAQK